MRLACVQALPTSMRCICNAALWCNTAFVMKIEWENLYWPIGYPNATAVSCEHACEVSTLHTSDRMFPSLRYFKICLSAKKRSVCDFIGQPWPHNSKWNFVRWLNRVTSGRPQVLQYQYRSQSRLTAENEIPPPVFTPLLICNKAGFNTLQIN